MKHAPTLLHAQTAVLGVVLPPIQSPPLACREAAAASLCVLFTWFAHGTNREALIGRDACSQPGSHRGRPITGGFTRDVACYWDEGFMGNVGFFYFLLSNSERTREYKCALSKCSYF